MRMHSKDIQARILKELKRESEQPRRRDGHIYILDLAHYCEIPDEQGVWQLFLNALKLLVDMRKVVHIKKNDADPGTYYLPGSSLIPPMFRSFYLRTISGSTFCMGIMRRDGYCWLTEYAEEAPYTEQLTGEKTTMDVLVLKYSVDTLEFGHSDITHLIPQLLQE